MSLPAAGRPHVRILLVSDDATVADACSRALRLDGFEVWTALSGDDGLRYAAAHSPHAVVIDVRTPLRSSLALAERMRGVAALATVPIGVVSLGGGRRASLLEEAGRLGILVKSKPLWLAELVDFARLLARPA